MSSNERTFIYIDENDYDMYKTLQDKMTFNKNLHIFTCAVLVGKFIVGKSLNIKKKKDFIRPAFNKGKDNLVILQSVAIAHEGNVSVLNDEEKLYSICEGYARTGISKMYEWYLSGEYDFDSVLGDTLIEKFEELNLDEIN